MKEVEFLEELRPLILSKTVEGAEGLVNEAIDLMKECIAVRGIKYCRYAGPDTKEEVNSQQDPSQIESSKKHEFRYIKEYSSVGIQILPLGRNGGNFIYAYEYINSNTNEKNQTTKAENRKISFSVVCNLGCDCNNKYDG